MIKKGANIFISFLHALKVKHTASFSNKYFNEHPHKYNLFGLSKMLSDYGIENAAARIADKENITAIETPFIAHFGGDFVIVHKADPDEVSFLWGTNRHVVPTAKFIEAWTGVVLLAEPSEKSIEPNYAAHKKNECLNLLKKILLFSACGSMPLFAYIYQSLHTNLGLSLLIVINFVGIYISWLLLLKQMHIQSRYADKICSLFKQKDCNKVLDSNAAKLWGIIGWSEIGFGYFLTNMLLLLISPATITYIALINIATLPYAFWSVWYQSSKAKQWCPLCLIVQVLLWAIFINNCLWGYIQIPTFDFQDLLNLSVIGSAYLASILGVNMLIPKLGTNKTVQFLQQTINSIKADENVFEALLKKQAFYETKNNDSIIRFGNPESSLQLTIFTNPYCTPCSMMHKRIEKLLEKVNNKISVQYILSSFTEELNSTNKYLLAACLKNTNDYNIQQLFTDWFEKGVKLQNDYFKNMSLDVEKQEVETEFQKHETWREKTQLRATPTVLVNGYRLPDNYRIEDLQYFTDLMLTLNNPCPVAGREQ